MRRPHLTAILTFTVLLAAAVAAAGEVPQRETLWRGEVVLAGTMEVPAGTVLRVAAGTIVRPLRPGAKIVVRGTLLVEGKEGGPVTFAAPAGWEGIELRESPRSRIVRARFFGAETALSAASSSFLLRGCIFRECETAVKLVRLSSPTVEDCLFQGNGIGIDQEMRSAPLLRRNVFKGQRQAGILSTHNSGGRIEGNRFEQNRQGIALLRQYGGEIAGNHFAANSIAVYCEQTRTTPRLRENRFEKNGQGISCISFSSPKVEGNVFAGNETALRNDQLSSPTVRHNLFKKNLTAIATLRRSTPRVEKNALEENDVALFCDYSSYPSVSANNFAGNRRGVELGANQSADFEKRYGSQAAVRQKSIAGKGKGQGGPPPMATPARESVDVRGNWWGRDTGRLAAAGAEGNAEIFHDRADRPTVTMAGYGEERFRLDRVLFHPWLEERVADAGPEKKKNPIDHQDAKGRR